MAPAAGTDQQKGPQADEPSLSPRQARWIAGAVLLLGVTALHLPALIGGTYFLDVYLTEVHPHFAAIGRALQSGELPLWTSEIMLGYPLAANPQVGTFYPPHLLGLWLLDAHVVLTLSVWLHGVVGAFGAYGLARQSGASRLGGVVSGLAWAALPFLMFYHMAIHGLVALALLPVILWTTWRAIDHGGTRWWAVGALLLALQMYAGHLQFVMYTLLATLPIAIWGAIWGAGRERGPNWRAGIVGCVGQGALAVLMYAPQLGPAFELWRLSLRKGLSAAEIVAAMNVEALGADDLVELIMPRFFGGPSFRDFWYPEFVGIGLLAVAVAGLRWSDRRARVWAGLALSAVIYLVCVQLPTVGEWVVSIPVLSAFRAPGRIVCWVLLALCILAGLGVDRIRDTPRRAAAVFVVGLALGIATLAGAFAGIAPRDPELSAEVIAHLRHEDGLALVIAAAAGLVALVVARRWRFGAVALAAAVLIPLGLVGARYAPVVYATETPPTADAIEDGARILGISAGDPAYMSSVPGPLGWPLQGDERLHDQAGWSLVANVGMAWGKANLHGQTSLPLSRFVRRMFGDTRSLGYPFQRHPEYAASLLEHVGVKYVITGRDGQMPVLPRPPFAREAGDYLIHELKARPRARFYPLTAVRGATGLESALSLVQRDGPTPDLPLLVEGMTGAAAGHTPSPPLPASLEVVGAGHFRVRVRAPTPGVLFVAESWYPRWQAWTGNTALEVHPADGAFIGIPLPAGDQVVELAIDSSLYVSGLPFMMVGLVLTLIGFLRRTRSETG